MLSPGKIALLGEMHGTEQSPAFALNVACLAAAANLQTIVGLENRPAEQGRVDTFLHSDGTEQDKKALMAGPQWQDDYQDGRNSAAMLGLYGGLRKLVRSGANISVVLFDDAGENGAQAREKIMADNLARVVNAAPEAFTIVLTGNIHSRVAVGVPWDAKHEPMGYLLAQQIAAGRIVSLNVDHAGGTAWMCLASDQGGCSVHELVGHGPEEAWQIDLRGEIGEDGHQGVYQVGKITASLPANKE